MPLWGRSGAAASTALRPRNSMNAPSSKVNTAVGEVSFRGNPEG
ncbi:hypothetical protein [Corallococcus sp. CA049B]|nr:hypothetical protein [Corallococcus sp. CA049B]